MFRHGGKERVGDRALYFNIDFVLASVTMTIPALDQYLAIGMLVLLTAHGEGRRRE
jgi:hypothetical protein